MSAEKKKIKDLALDSLLKSIQWVQTPLLTVPRDYLPKKPKGDTPIDKSIAEYVTYQEIYEGTDKIENNEKLFFKEISEFDFNDAFQSLAKLNYLLSEGYHQKNPEELIYVDQLFSGELRKRLKNFWHLGRKIFYRQQLLGLIKTNIVKNDKRKDKKLVGKDLEAFARVMFRVTDFTESDRIEKERRAKSEKEREKIRLGTYCRNIHFNSTHRFGNLLPRYWTIYFECIKEAERLYPGQTFPIAREFRKVTGLDLELFILLAFGLYGRYLTVGKSVLMGKRGEFLIDNRYFQNLKPKVRKGAKRIFSILADSKRGFKKEFESEDRKGGSFYYNFQPFWRKPFYKLNENAYFLLDPEYFQEKITFGIYGQISDYYAALYKGANAETKKEIDRKRFALNAFTGRCLEIYVGNLLKRLYPSHPALACRLFSEMEGHPTGGVDFIVYYPTSLVFIEVTISGIRHNTVLTGDFAEIEKEIRQIFFSAENRKSKGKVVQLNDAINSFKKGGLGGLKIDPKTIKQFYPVLVLEKGIPIIPPIFTTYLDWIQEKELLQGHLDNFTLIDLEELEMVESLVAKGVELPEILEHYKSSGYGGLPFKNFLAFERKDICPNQFLGNQMDKMFRDVEKYFSRTDK
jgi:hypothetical protein